LRVESSVTAVSWLPSEAVRGIRRLPFTFGAARYDDPPADRLEDAAALVRDGRARQANELRAWIEVEDGRVTAAGHAGEAHAPAGGDALPVLRNEPETGGAAATFVQTVGGHFGLPIPRRVAGLPLLKLAAPVAWTTLRLTLNADGSSDFALSGASAFPRHWVYDADGNLASKSAEIDFDRWLEQAGAEQTPWGAEDSAELSVPAESALERRLSDEIMSTRRRVVRVPAGDMLTEHGAGDRRAYLVLDGILDVDVGGQTVAEVGPGSIVGERAALEGRRTATLRARTDCRVVPFDPAELDPDTLAELAEAHHREDEN
jgi:hypothetical protein